MSGHSKWAQIKRQKGVADAKRGQLFTKLSMAISIAVRQGGGVGDPSGNPRLRMAVDTARVASMPKENIERAIQRALGKQASEMEEVTYEGFGPGGFSVIIEAITDNKQRTTPEVKNKMEKSGGTMGVPGSVSYQFEKKGMITLAKDGKTMDDIFLIAADAGAEDVEDAGDEALVYTNPEDLAKVRDTLKEGSMNIKNAEFIRKPLSVIPLTDLEKAKKAIQFTEQIEEMDDVQKVYANFDIPDEIGKQIV